jgi:ADP-heptose:LPS heptosyltransferase
MNILVIRLTSMGDVVLATPLFTFLRKKYPEARISFCTSNLYADLFTRDARISRVVSISSELDTSAIRESKYDWIIDLQNNRKSRRIISMALPCSQISRFDKLHWKRALLLFFRINLFDAGQTVVRRYLNAGGYTDSDGAIPGLSVEVPPASEGTAFGKISSTVIQSIKNQNLILALAPFSAWKNKEWPAANYTTVAKYFAHRGWKIIILGGSEDMAQGTALQESIGTSCISVAGSCSLYECAVILKHTALVLGNDTGLVHLARAVGARTGTVFGSTTHHFGFYPYGKPEYCVFEAREWCRPCHAHGGDRCWRVSRPCLAAITAEQVIRGLESLSG